MVPWAALDKALPEIKGHDSSPLHSTGEATSEVLCPVLGTRDMDTLDRVQQRAMKMIKGLEHEHWHMLPRRLWGLPP